MSLPVKPPIDPMLAALADQIPAGPGWRDEPKWDGFRAIVFREGERVDLASRKGQPLERYFPELLTVLRDRLPERCVVDGEIVIVGDRGLDFDSLLLRIHPAASRIQLLAAQSPSSFVAFDLLALGDEDLRPLPFDRRREKLERSLHFGPRLMLAPQTSELELAREWFDRFEGAGLDGIVAKRAELPYLPGKRVMVKVKHQRTADCVVGGYRLSKAGDAVGSLLLGLYDDSGVLHHVGHTSSFAGKQRREILEKLAPLKGEGSFGGGRTPGQPSRWNQGRDTAWVGVAPKLVCEVAFDHLQGDRFRHATRFLRWRPDKPPRECTYEQLRPPRAFSLSALLRSAHG